MFNTYFGLLFSVDEWICLSLDSLGVAVCALRCISSFPTWPITQAGLLYGGLVPLMQIVSSSASLMLELMWDQRYLSHMCDKRD